MENLDIKKIEKVGDKLTGRDKEQLEFNESIANLSFKDRRKFKTENKSVLNRFRYFKAQIVLALRKYTTEEKGYLSGDFASLNAVIESVSKRYSSYSAAHNSKKDRMLTVKEDALSEYFHFRYETRQRAAFILFLKRVELILEERGLELREINPKGIVPFRGMEDKEAALAYYQAVVKNVGKEYYGLKEEDIDDNIILSNWDDKKHYNEACVEIVNKVNN